MVDIWALGVTLYEMYHLKLMFQDGMYHAVVMRILDNQHQPFDPECPESIAKLIILCTKISAALRPSIDELIEQVDQFKYQADHHPDETAEQHDNSQGCTQCSLQKREFESQLANERRRMQGQVEKAAKEFDQAMRDAEKRTKEEKHELIAQMKQQEQENKELIKKMKRQNEHDQQAALAEQSRQKELAMKEQQVKHQAT